MKRSGRINLIGGLLDLPIIDNQGRFCGIVDDIEMDRKGDAPPMVKYLLAGPGAYRGRLPNWAFRLVTLLAGTRVTRVPWEAIDHIDSSVTLNVDAAALGLDRSEARARAFIPKWGAM